MIEASFFRSLKISFSVSSLKWPSNIFVTKMIILRNYRFINSNARRLRYSSSQRQSQESRASSSVEPKTSSSILLKKIRRDDVNNEVINLCVVQMFNMYQNSRIKNHELYDAIFHDFFDLISNHWNMFTSIIWNFVNTICYT